MRADIAAVAQMKGCEAIGETALRAGCQFFYAHPMIPATDLVEYMARQLPEQGGVFLQAESSLAAINMAYGSAAAGKRVMVASSSSGVSLMQEGLSALAGAELPLVIVNFSCSGPGLGNVYPSQGDYFQATRCGHGDYHLIVLAPASVQEAAELTGLAFQLAERHRNPVMILMDGALGQMVEKVQLPVQEADPLGENDWAATGAKGRERRLITSVYLPAEDLGAHNLKLKEKYQEVARKHALAQPYCMEKAEVAAVAFGTAARSVAKGVDKLRAEGFKAGLIRPITLFPFPFEVIRNLAERVRAFVVVEMNLGQMIEDVRLAVAGKRPVASLAISGGAVPTPAQVEEALRQALIDF